MPSEKAIQPDLSTAILALTGAVNGLNAIVANILYSEQMDCRTTLGPLNVEERKKLLEEAWLLQAEVNERLEEALNVIITERD